LKLLQGEIPAGAHVIADAEGDGELKFEIASADIEA
jgi:hypothetical protein